MSSRTFLLLPLLTLLACDDQPVRAPSPPRAASAFQDAPPPEAPAAPAPALPVPAAPVPPPTPTAPAANAPARKPEQLFNDLGCVACHGEGRPFASRLADARAKPAETVAVWILDPQKVRPGTLMPTFQGRITTAEALGLAQWIKAGNPVLPNVP